MPPYYSTCVEYYSPSATFTQIIIAFVIGYVVALIFTEMFKQTGVVIDFADVDAPALRAELEKIIGQRDRALRVVAILLAALWLGFTTLAISNNPIGGISDKTEL